MKAIRDANIVLRDAVLQNHALLYDTHIRGILPEGDVPADAQIIDAGGKYLIPGLLDLHIHGAAGIDTMDADEEGLLYMASRLLENGVTGFLPTTVSMPDADIGAALASLGRAKSRMHGGARILGAHLEGPYLNGQKKGAHEARFLKPPDRGFVEKYREVIRILTLAPELDAGLEFTDWCVKNGIIVSLGHSMATYEQAAAAFNHGASHATHLFNAMRGLHHREPGLTGAALLNDDVSVELIADTVHVRKELYPLIYRTKGRDNILLVTDCMRAGMMPPGRYTLGGLDVYTDRESARLADGSLAGSVLRLNDAVRNFETYAGIPRHQAVAMASFNPARRLGLDTECGSLSPGLRADMALADEELRIERTILFGKTVYRAGA